mmetsp:Transcript_34029/g.46721  ORF Transcript_34029/g.46721 Transcript_34029/m.46721 type:complete len:80 (+) Transcript_34029:1441-1680(+)
MILFDETFSLNAELVTETIPHSEVKAAARDQDFSIEEAIFSLALQPASQSVISTKTTSIFWTVEIIGVKFSKTKPSAAV